MPSTPPTSSQPSRPIARLRVLYRRATAMSGLSWAIALSVLAHAAGIVLMPGWQSTVAERETPVAPTVRIRIEPPVVRAEAVPVAPAEAPARTAPPRQARDAAPAAPMPASHPHRPVEERAPAVLSVHREAAVARQAMPAGDSQGEPAPSRPALTESGAASPAAAAPAREQMQVATAANHADTMRHTDVAWLHNPKPAYPPMARKLGLEGTVLLRILVNREGVPEESKVLVSAGTEVLDSAALEAVKLWRFVPAREGKAAIAHWVDVPVTFRLAAR